MRLTQIKLAGFKSFVDVTKIPFNQPLTAIVGPNGCGKSNVIDAVRWVLGESSAKHLRGDSMADVIFNGSNARRPVSVASVELLFDNQQGRLAGQYASYQEIAVKRQVSRDGDSSYFLNGQKCRRKDVTDLFMGTGLGPRSYAIIEQGTISRLIESKPHELRVFIEEAAGISRYKERRRETENRIRHTRENLERLGDIRQELQRQLQKLEEQAQDAKQYRQLKQAERQLDAELTVSRFLEFTSQTATINQQLNEHQLSLSELDAQKQALSLQMTQVKLSIDELDKNEHQYVERYYQSSTEIAKLEQSIKHTVQQDAHLTEQVADIHQRQLALTQQHSDTSSAQAVLAQELTQATDVESQLQLDCDNLKEQLFEAEALYDDAREALQQQQFTSKEKHHATEVAKRDELHAEQQSHNLQQQIQQSEHQLSQLNTQSHHENLNRYQDELTSQLAAQDNAQQLIKMSAEQLAKTELQCHQLKLQEEALAQSLAEERGRSAAVTQLLPDADKQEGAALWQCIAVKPGWEAAVDVLLESILTQQVEVDVNQLGFNTAQPAEWPGLQTEVNLSPWLKDVHWEQTLDIAKQRVTGLAPHERVITADGYLVGQGFVLQKSINTLSLVQLRAELDALTDSIAASEIQLAKVRSAYSEQLTLQLSHKQAQEQAIKSHQQYQVSLTQLRADIEAEHASIRVVDQQKTHLLQQQQTWQQQLQKLQQQALSHSQQLAVYQQQQQEAQLQVERLTAELANCDAQRKTLSQSAQQSSAQLLKQQRHIQQLQSQQTLHAQQLQQYQGQLDEFDSRLDKLKLQLSDSVDDSDALQKMQQKLASLLVTQTQQQADLSEVRATLSQLQQQFEQLGVEQKQRLGKIEHLTQAISTLKLRREGIKGQLDSQQLLIDEQQINLEAISAELDVSKSLQWRQKELSRVKAQIEHLGAINLAAIEEFEQQSERKHYLDSQDSDLTSALTRLEEAIRKIDKETKSRFKETYDKVNRDLGVLFPKVFGGGSAHLALTDDNDLLETGVTIMARPPGKKNSTIHLLSGGEKALTALSLVFAIFRLNPAPFCMLDEVDAPLDDANVDRFCRLVKEMSASVQFVYISHNKITMELADQLIGVTMHEAGVSRIVAVDIDEAVAMADAV
ncbi:chromosome segregation protein SMC [Shewanella waksmanii]|uniref:chromosome segregation protein SMC n=1 Tax=Shewanella waksmanii TaxID=213783 RepID=UPI00048D935C|nr:chromosome segregation protein SMC [Shewanella waksmanii]